MTGSLLVLAGADLDSVPNRVRCVLGDTEHTFRVQVDGGSALVSQPAGAAVNCQEPRVRAAGGACCWPGQVGPSCSGPPACPAPLVGVRDWCELPALSIARTQSVLVEADLVQRCFTEHEVPLALRLPLVLSLRIGPGGQVESASMEAPPALDGSEVVACLLRESAALRFPPTDAGGALVYPVAGIPLSEPVQCVSPRTPQGVGCCWPGQEGDAGACRGAPDCPPPLVAEGEWCVSPGLSPAQVQPVLADAALVPQCFATAEPIPGPTRLVLVVEVAPEGTVTTAEVEAPAALQGSEVLACLERESKALHLPATASGGAVYYPLVWSP
jgi:hypothetical protein